MLNTPEVVSPFGVNITNLSSFMKDLAIRKLIQVNVNIPVSVIPQKWIVSMLRALLDKIDFAV